MAHAITSAPPTCLQFCIPESSTCYKVSLISGALFSSAIVGMGVWLHSTEMIALGSLVLIIPVAVGAVKIYNDSHALKKQPLLGLVVKSQDLVDNTENACLLPADILDKIFSDAVGLCDSICEQSKTIYGFGLVCRQWYHLTHFSQNQSSYIFHSLHGFTFNNQEGNTFVFTLDQQLNAGMHKIFSFKDLWSLPAQELIIDLSKVSISLFQKAKSAIVKGQLVDGRWVLLILCKMLIPLEDEGEKMALSALRGPKVMITLLQKRVCSQISWLLLFSDFSKYSEETSVQMPEFIDEFRDDYIKNADGSYTEAATITYNEKHFLVDWLSKLILDQECGFPTKKKKGWEESYNHFKLFEKKDLQEHSL